MRSFQKNRIRFSIFVIFIFVLFFPRISWAGTIPTGGGCETQSEIDYQTGCGETKQIGGCSYRCCHWDEEGHCTKHCWDCNCPTQQWDEYRCESPNCDGDIQIRTCEVSREGSCPSSCGNDRCCVTCSEWRTCEDCGSWQKPVREPCQCSEAGLNKPECKCRGDCIDMPRNPPRYYKDPLYPLNECNAEDEYQMKSNNIYLPVKLDWDDVTGWKEGWSSDGQCQQVATCAEGGLNCVGGGNTIGECETNCWLNCISDPRNEEILKNLKCYERAQKQREIFNECTDECRNNCQSENQTTAGGCTAENCPYPDKCYPSSEYVQSYVIRIEGDMRNCEALEKIDELEEEIETDPQKKGEDETEIKIIRENELATSTYTEVLGKSEFIPPCSCMFKSNRTYTWHVKACCDAGGTSCGPESDWSFITSPAPEPKLPYDPDWAGAGGAENLSKEEIGKLEWCEINDPQRYGRIIIGKDEEWYSPQSDKVFIYYLDPQSVQYKCHPNLETSKGCEPMLLTPDPESRDPFSSLIHPFEFVDKDYVYFTKLNSYSWKVSAAEGFAGYNPTEYSQEWKFSTENFPLPQPQLGSPPDNTEIPVGLPVLLKWASPYAHSFNYIVEGGSKIMRGKTDVHNITFDFPNLFLDTIYKWKINPCWDYRAEECENFWAGRWSFKTTGRPPNPDTMKPAGTDIPIPVNFEWESVPGAKSFIFEISGDGFDFTNTTTKSNFILDYPNLHQKKDYSWKVKTCARDNGEVCGAWRSEKTFTTFKLSAPSNPSPPENQKVFTYEMPGNFSWEPVPYARYYKYTINYVSKSADEATEECQPQEGTVIVEKIVTQPSDFVSLNCLGKYEWQVTACLNASCQEDAIGKPSPIWLFELVQSGGPGGGGLVGSLTGGLVPCGRTFDDPNTLWNERESCQIKHIFILIKSIIDFLLWKLAPLLLVFLLVYTGAIYYLAMGAPEAIARVKSLWRAAGIGYLLIFIAWNIVSFVLTLFGYRVGIFGPWWKIF